MSFETAFENTIGHEGGYVNDPKDPGGETRYGISKRSYPSVDIKNLSLASAKEIYRRDYWDKVRGDELPEVVADQVFDAAVNHGVTPAVRMLQAALGVTVDGVIGPQTILASHAINPQRAAILMNVSRLELMTSLLSWPSFGRGWARRCAANIRKVLT